ncbi:MAG: DUF378 domain-containing protein [Candidatus Aminicenantaceae bacterium]
MGKLNTLDWICLILVIIGGLNWLLVGVFSFDLVSAIFGVMSVISRIVYILVGVSALYVLIFMLPKMGKKTKTAVTP